MNIDETLFVPGVFQRELKNRFRCVVRLADVDEVCYVSSSCKLENLIDLSGKDVLLTPSAESTMLPHTLFAVKQGRKTTILNLSVANAVIFEQLRKRRFSFLGKRKSTRREVLLGGYKADIFIDDTHTAIEIKTIITSKKQAIFPSVRSERSLGQLEHIKNLLLNGYRVCYMFVSLSPDVKGISLDRTTPFYSAFIDCVNSGMSYYGCTLKMHNGEITIASSLNVEI